MSLFQLQSKYKISDQQETAVAALCKGLDSGLKHQTLIGVTGSGKTFNMANIIARANKPSLVLAHNKTLAAQLFAEFREFFPNNAVEYFVSYYDYYQPEAYVPRRDLYIEKESDINETIERYRSAATQALLTRRDTIIVASVSCIYGLGNPEDYMSLSREVKINDHYSREKLLRHLSDMQYERSEYDFYPGLYRVRGDTVDVYLATGEEALRIEYFGDNIDSLKLINPVSGEVLTKPDSFKIFPAKQFVTPYESLKAIIPTIREDLIAEVELFKKQNKLLEANRLEQRVNFDLEMLQETGYCSGIENYSRYIERRKPGTPPSTLLDYFPDDWLLFIDESHITVPQVRGMYNGDKVRKETLVDYGFRLKAAVDNRPLKFTEFDKRTERIIYVSATPAEYELELSKKEAKSKLKGYTGVVEQLIRPTGLLDPEISVRPIEATASEELITSLKANKFETLANDVQLNGKNQIDDLINEITNTLKKKQRVLVTTLTKRMAEDLSNFLLEIGIKVQYIHSDIDAVKRVEILRDLRLGKFDVLVGINLLREGLDLPEVSLVAILDADKEGFLRSRTSLIQTIGRAARHEEGRVIMYANHVTGSMQLAISETFRRRQIQLDFNKMHGITPKSIVKEIKELIIAGDKEEQKEETATKSLFKSAESFNIMKPKEKKKLLQQIETEMNIMADMLEFEKAADLRDLLNSLKK